MKVLQINAVYEIASTGRTCKELQEYIIENGGECVTIYGEGKQSYNNTVFMGNLIDHKIHALLSRITGKVGYYSSIPTLRLFRYIEKYQPDIVHLRVLHSNFINIPMLICYLGKHDIATVVTLHDCFLYTGKCCHYIDSGCTKWEKACYDCPAYKEWNPSWFFDRTSLMFRDKVKGFSSIRRLAVVGVSNWISSEAKKSVVFSGRHIETIYNWVDLSIFKPTDSNVKRKLNIEGKKMILGVASDWSDKKGLCDFIQLAECLDDSYVIVLIGSLPDGIELPRNLISLSRTTDVNQLCSYYSAADVFLQLSRQETFGKVTAEALACGTPVVTYNNTANAEMAFDGCGLCVKQTGDVAAVAEAIKELIEFSSSNQANQCRQIAEECFSSEKNCHRYLELYQELMKG